MQLCGAALRHKGCDLHSQNIVCKLYIVHKVDATLSPSYICSKTRSRLLQQLMQSWQLCGLKLWRLLQLQRHVGSGWESLRRKWLRRISRRSRRPWIRTRRWGAERARSTLDA